MEEGAASPFKDLLQRLLQEHENEVNLLKKQIIALGGKCESMEASTQSAAELQPISAILQSQAADQVAMAEMVSRGCNVTIGGAEAVLADQKEAMTNSLELKEGRASLPQTSSKTNKDKPRQRNQVVAMLPQWIAAEAEVENMTTEQMHFMPSERQLQKFGVLWAVYGDMQKKTTKSFKQRYMDPNAAPLLTWTMCGMLLLFMDVITMPLQVFFDEEPEDIPFYFWFGQFVCYFWTVDILINMTAGYYDKDGRLILSQRAVWCHYAKSWMLLDCFVVGNDWLSIMSDYISGGSSETVPSELRLLRLSKMTRFLRALRALRILRLAKAGTMMQKIQDSIGSEFLLIIGSALQNIAVLLLMNHCICCLWYYFGTQEGGHWVTEYEVKKLNTWGRYVMSLHWSLTQFTPAGMHVQPQTIMERTFAVTMIIIAMLSFSTFVAGITASMTGLRQMAARSRTQWATLTKYLDEHHLSPDLRLRLVSHIEEAMQGQGEHTIGREDVILLKLLSGPLKIELELAMHQRRLALHPFFASHMEISPSTCPIIFGQALVDRDMAKGECLFHNDEHAKTMFFLNKGTMDYRPGVSVKDHESDHKHSIKIGQHCHISEPALWIDWYYAGTLTSMQEAEVIVLDGLAFYKAMKVDPRAVNHAYQYAKDFVADISDVLEKSGVVLDLTPELLSHDQHHFMSRSKNNIKEDSQEKVNLRKSGHSWTTYAHVHPQKLHTEKAPVEVPAKEFDVHASVKDDKADFEYVGAIRPLPKPLLMVATREREDSKLPQFVP